MLKFKKAFIFIILILTTSCNTGTIEEPVYKIAFQTNNDQVVSPVYYDGLSSLSLPYLFKEGHKSEGWYLDADFQTRVTDENINLLKLQQNNTFHHKWLPISYKINYFLNGGVLSQDTINSFDINQLPVTLPTPNRNGLIFQGWHDSYYLSGKPVYQISNISNDNLIYFAKWGIDEDSFDKIIDFDFFENHSYFLTQNGRVFIWGANWNGQLGDGTTKSSLLPTEITNNFNLSIGDKIISVSLGGIRSSALSSNGRVFTWGRNSFVQLGDNTTTKKLVPTEITYDFRLIGDDKIVAISSGRSHSSALSSKGRVFTWGGNSSGQIGNGKNNVSWFESPQEITRNFKLDYNDVIVGVSLGNVHSSALSSKGRVFTWGGNSNAQLGEGSWIDRNTPQEITSRFSLTAGDKIVALFLGGTHSAALSANGSVFFWGWNKYGQLGDRSDQIIDGHRRPREIDHMSRFDLNFEEKIISISLGSYHSLALTSNNRIFAWGRNDNYQVEESLSNFNNLVPKEITNTVNLKEYGDIYFLKARADNSAILTSKGHVLVWGDNSGGQIGDSTTKDRSKPHVITFNQPSD
jgi:hypothetical protein